MQECARQGSGCISVLHEFHDVEKLSGANTWYCGHCKDHVEATKRVSLWRLPPVLVIQLKRFKHQK